MSSHWFNVYLSTQPHVYIAILGRELGSQFIILYLPYITASTVWDPHLIKDHKVLEDVQKLLVEVCTKTWHTDYHTFLDGLHIPTPEARRIGSNETMFPYKLIDNNTQILPTSQRNCPYTTRSTHSKQLENILCHSSQYFNSYFPKLLLIGITFQHLLYHVRILSVLVLNVNYTSLCSNLI